MRPHLGCSLVARQRLAERFSRSLFKGVRAKFDPGILAMLLNGNDNEPGFYSITLMCP